MPSATKVKVWLARDPDPPAGGDMGPRRIEHSLFSGRPALFRLDRGNGEGRIFYVATRRARFLGRIVLPQPVLRIKALAPGECVVAELKLEPPR